MLGIIILFSLLGALFISARVYMVRPKRVVWKNVSRSKHLKSVKTMIVLGSGGHTAEMFRALETLNLKKFSPRVYVVAETDIGVNSSAEKAKSFEKLNGGNADIQVIPRSREVGQSYITSVFTTLRASLYSLFIVYNHSPDVILCNGPGTCVPICVSGFLMKVLNKKKGMKIVFSESFACVSHMSLTGKILYRFVDLFCVQWNDLKSQFPKAEYIGRLQDNTDYQALRRETSSDKGYVLVTVGSTKFDELIESVDNESFISTISSLGYKGIHIQYGRGQYVPHKAKSSKEMEVVTFDFKESLQKEIAEASLIISHAGAGSILESLSYNKPLVVVPNEKLMNNHQMELAIALGKKGFLYFTKLDKNESLQQLISTMDIKTILPFPSSESLRFRALMNALLHFEMDDKVEGSLL